MWNNVPLLWNEMHSKVELFCIFLQKRCPFPFQAQKIFPAFEAASKCFPTSTGSKIKKGENYKRRDTWSISKTYNLRLMSLQRREAKGDVLKLPQMSSIICDTWHLCYRPARFLRLHDSMTETLLFVISTKLEIKMKFWIVSIQPLFSINAEQAIYLKAHSRNLEAGSIFGTRSYSSSWFFLLASRLFSRIRMKPKPNTREQTRAPLSLTTFPDQPGQ